MNRVTSEFLGLSVIQRFNLSSAIIMLVGMAGIGWWVGEQIEIGVIKEATASTALYMDSFIAPNIQELASQDTLDPSHIEALNQLFDTSNLGQRTLSIKIWSRDHRIIYSNIPSLIGRVFPDTSDQLSSWDGTVTGEISGLEEDENVEERRLSSEPLLEVYSPVRLNDTNQVIAVAEFYQRVDTLEAKIAAAQRQGWLMVGSTMFAIYLLLIGFVRWAGNRIASQEIELKNQVVALTKQLARNSELSMKVRGAAANSASLNENLLRRVSAELHDGPVQEVSTALLRLDQALELNETCRLTNGNSTCNDGLRSIQTSLHSSLQEMRAIAARLGLPQLANLTVMDVILHVVRSHEQHARVKILLTTESLPIYASLPVKNAVYRFIQEGLNHIHRLTGTTTGQVNVSTRMNHIHIEIFDEGFDVQSAQPDPGFNSFEMSGLRDRIESQGGFFAAFHDAHGGIKLTAELSLQHAGETTYG